MIRSVGQRPSPSATIRRAQSRDAVSGTFFIVLQGVAHDNWPTRPEHPLRCRRTRMGAVPRIAGANSDALLHYPAPGVLAVAVACASQPRTSAVTTRPATLNSTTRFHDPVSAHAIHAAPPYAIHRRSGQSQAPPISCCPQQLNEAVQQRRIDEERTYHSHRHQRIEHPYVRIADRTFRQPGHVVHRGSRNPKPIGHCEPRTLSILASRFVRYPKVPLVFETADTPLSARSATRLAAPPMPELPTLAFPSAITATVTTKTAIATRTITAVKEPPRIECTATPVTSATDHSGVVGPGQLERH